GWLKHIKIALGFPLRLSPSARRRRARARNCRPARWGQTRPTFVARLIDWPKGNSQNHKNCEIALRSTVAPMKTHKFLLQIPFLLLLVAAPLAGHGQPVKPSQPNDLGHYEFRQQHDPDGIGKFFMGREIAHVMGHQAADWLERAERQQEERPALPLAW